MLYNVNAFFARKHPNSVDNKQYLSARAVETGNGSPDAVLKEGIANFYDQVSIFSCYKGKDKRLMLITLF